ncbi:hypothetical protein [Deinococcus sp. UYEF24]
MLAPTLLVMSTLLCLTIAASTVAQALGDHPYVPGQLMTLVVPFLLPALVGMGLTLAWFRHLPLEGRATWWADHACTGDLTSLVFTSDDEAT